MKKKIVVAVLALVLGAMMALTGCAKKEKVKIITTSADNKVITLTEEEYAYGVDKNQPELKTKVDEILTRIMSDGTLEDIINIYFDDSRESERVEVLEGTRDTANPDSQLTVATNSDFPPFEYKEGDKLTGIDIHIAKLIADELELSLYIDDMDFDSVVLAVENHTDDIAMAGLTITEDRAKVVNFSVPYYSSNQVLIVRESNTDFDKCQTAEDIEAVLASYKKNKKKAGFQNGTTGQFYVEDFANLKAKGYKAGALAVQDLYNGRIDMVIIDEMPAKAIVAGVNK